MLLALLAAALRPVMEAAQRWIGAGILHDPDAEFFVQQREWLA